MIAILDENDLDDIVLNVTKEPPTNAGKLAYKRNKVRLEESFMILSKKQ